MYYMYIYVCPGWMISRKQQSGGVTFYDLRFIDWSCPVLEVSSEGSISSRLARKRSQYGCAAASSTAVLLYCLDGSIDNCCVAEVVRCNRALKIYRPKGYGGGGGAMQVVLL